jgi:hypothetical protein
MVRSMKLALTGSVVSRTVSVSSLSLLWDMSKVKESIIPSLD